MIAIKAAVVIVIAICVTIFYGAVLAVASKEDEYEERNRKMICSIDFGCDDCDCSDCIWSTAGNGSGWNETD